MIARILLAAGIVVGAVALWILFWIAFMHFRFHNYHRKTGRDYPSLGLGGWLEA